jgi:hypothetical protein
MAEKKIRNKRIKPFKPSKLDLPNNSDVNLSFIAGHKSGDAPFGLTWEEFNPNHDNEDHISTNTRHGQLR